MRIAETRRRAMERRVETVETPFGSVRVKMSEGCGVQRRKAEYDDLARIARERDMSISQVRRELDAAASLQEKTL
jgi:uncharacterized protein (DUF111 family)